MATSENPMFFRANSIIHVVLCLFAIPWTHAELAWQKETIQTEATFGTKVMMLRFPFSNNGEEPVLITEINVSCGCVEPLVEELPWTIVPGVEETLEIKVNLQGKKGLVRQTLEVKTGEKITELVMKVMIEDPVHRPMSPEERANNLAQSKLDRKAIFKGNCADCHAKPTQRKYGRTLYESACGICHDSKNRASVVPDLKDKIKSETREYWHQWIQHGKLDGLMPGFAASEGGPLSNSQISTLLNHISKLKKDQLKTSK